MIYRAKYPLAVVDYVCSNVPGRKLLGYDIGCAFQKTLANSSVASKFQGRCTMNAMHGWSHIRPCQCTNHPLYLENVGLSDMEDCERSFSQSNLVASLTRHASIFHRHQFIDMHFQHADGDRYKALGRFQFENIRQARRIISENRKLLFEAEEVHGYTGVDYQAWLEEEKEYLLTVGKGPEEDKQIFQYVRALDEWSLSE